MPEVTLNGRTFPLKDDPPKAGALMEIARAETQGDKEAMAAYLDFLYSMLADAVDPRAVKACIVQMDFAEINDALAEAAESYKVDPSSAGRESSSRSADGQPAGERTSRVVSFSQDKPQAS
jgi:hypothetical protein